MAKDLSKLTTDELGLLFPILIVDFDTNWLQQAESESENIKNVVGKEFISRIEHIGSTSVPGLCAKPTAKGYSRSGITGQTFHIHVRYAGDWDEIVFRDYLIKNQTVADEYARLKRKLAEEFKNDREKYTESKTAFIKNTILIARLAK